MLYKFQVQEEQAVQDHHFSGQSYIYSIQKSTEMIIHALSGPLVLKKG